MKVLVTGGAGFIGSVLVPRLLEQGHEVTVIDNLMWGGESLWNNWFKPRYRFVNGDIRNEKHIKFLLTQNQVVVHLAALVGCDLCKKNKKQATEVNVKGTKNISKHLSEDQLLIFASTGSVYGKQDGSQLTENTKPNPPSHYGKTKYQAEKLCFKKNNAVILRFGTVFGTSYRTRLDLLVNKFVYEAITTKKLKIYGKNYLRSIIHVQDISQAIIFAIKNKERMKNQIFNVGSSKLVFTKEEIVQHIKQQVNFDLLFVEDSNADGSNYNFDTYKIESLGFQPKATLDQGIKELIIEIQRMNPNQSNFNQFSETKTHFKLQTPS